VKSLKIEITSEISSCDVEGGLPEEILESCVTWVIEDIVELFDECRLTKFNGSTTGDVLSTLNCD
jgi:hypothetical protein